MFHSLFLSYKFSFHDDNLYDKCKEFLSRYMTIKNVLKQKNQKMINLKYQNRKLVRENEELELYIRQLLQDKYKITNTKSTQTEMLINECNIDDDIEVISLNN